jgi:hypothetical protein
MKVLHRILSVAAPSAVVGAILVFVYYSLYVYQPSGHLYCGSSTVAKQTDVAVHVVRQWAGKEGPMLLSCPGSV